MSNLPGILVIGVHKFEPNDIIKLILKTENLAEAQRNDGISLYNWQISNKYYTADICFSPVQDKSALKEALINSVEAVIFYFDIRKENCTKELDNWICLLKNCVISTKVAICSSLAELSDIQKDTVEEWCINNKYELVELETETSKTQEEEAGFSERTGIERIIEILDAHEWPNLVMKGNKNKKVNTSINANSSNQFDLFSESLNSNFSAEDFDDEFENMEQLNSLFKNLQSMKQQISSLSTSEKLDQAEKVVKAFWNAIDGDSNEFSDSDNEAVS